MPICTDSNSHFSPKLQQPPGNSLLKEEALHQDHQATPWTIEQAGYHWDMYIFTKVAATLQTPSSRWKPDGGQNLPAAGRETIFWSPHCSGCNIKGPVKSNFKAPVTLPSVSLTSSNLKDIALPENSMENRYLPTSHYYPCTSTSNIISVFSN